MSKQEQVLIIEPQHELKFEGTFTCPLTSYIKLTNPSDKRVGFKIKTTAPKKYCVRPNSGVLYPKDNTNIAVSLQAHDFDQSEKNKHKFMVQTMFLPEEDFNFETLWRNVKEDAVMGTKLKCVFERVDSTTASTGTGVETAVSAAIAGSVQSSHEDKTKRIGDSPSVHHQGEELQKAAKEVKQLREDESSLRQENLQLKEEILRLRQLCKSDGHSQSAQMRASVVQPAQPVQPLLVIIAIVVGMVGIVLGKFIL